MENKLSFDIEADELEIFLEESNEYLQTMEAGILRLEQASDPGTINEIFRAAHTLKALAGTIGHHRLAELTHTMETLFDEMRSAKFSPTQGVIDDLLRSVDVLKVLLNEVVTLEPSQVELATLLTRLKAALSTNNGQERSKNNPNQLASLIGHHLLTPDQTAQAGRYQAAGQNLIEIGIAASADAFAPAARLAQAVMALAEVGEVMVQQPTVTDLTNGQHEGRLWLILATQAKLETIKQLLDDVSDLAGFQVQSYQIETILSVPPSTNGTSPAGGSGGQSGDKTVRISVERLDILMNLVGELVTSRNRMLQLENSWRSQVSSNGTGSELSDVTSHVSRVVDQLQEEVMRARMLPIGALFDKFPRIVRDVARLSGKQVNLVIEGEATELDRSLIEVIGDPLIHLLRNSVDHGLETSQERVALGKLATGTVRLTAAHLEGQIVITVEDDGRGIDPNRVVQAAVRRGVLTEAEAAQIDDEAAIDLIFQPNLSTAERVTELSGRGVGLDVVRANVEQLSGSVVVESILGRGTKFRVTLPLTLAIVQAMLVSVQSQVYAIPLASIVESLYLSEVNISTVKGCPSIQWRKSVLPLLDLREFFAVRLSDGGKDTSANTHKPAVITVNWGKLRSGLVVDKIIGKQDIVVKALSPIIGQAPGLSGGAILGDGHIALIIDVPNLINAALRLKRQLT